MYKRWQGNTGVVDRVEERPAPPPAPAGPAPPPPPRPGPPPGPMPRPGAAGEELPPFFGRLFGMLGDLETEDLLMILILYLLYRESGDVEMLLILGFLFLV